MLSRHELLEVRGGGLDSEILGSRGRDGAHRLLRCLLVGKGHVPSHGLASLMTLPRRVLSRLVGPHNDYLLLLDGTDLVHHARPFLHDGLRLLLCHLSEHSFISLSAPLHLIDHSLLLVGSHDLGYDAVLHLSDSHQALLRQLSCALLEELEVTLCPA